MTKSQIDKLGDRLRQQRPPSEELLTALQEYRTGFARPLGEVQRQVDLVLGVRSTGRIKTVNTIIEKLIRSKTRLTTMQDIAGVRVVLEAGGLQHQDLVVGRLRGAFGEHRIDDLRDRSRFGYRAVHVIVTTDGRPVEVQVRTNLQDEWAQGMEKLADRVGRGIRYGEPPNDGQDLKLLEAVLQTADALSEMIRDRERGDEDVRKLEQDLHDVEPEVAPEQRAQLRRIQSRLDALREARSMALENLKARLKQFAELSAAM